MNRRLLLCWGVVLGLIAVAGCAGQAPDSQVLQPSWKNITSTEDNKLKVVLEITNTAAQKRTTTISVTANINGTIYRNSKQLSIKAGKTTTVTIIFDKVSYQEFLQDGQLRMEFE
ncbi:MAG: hypothetical protein ABEI06_04940 [Halobacteriaceae archaeon]